MNIIKFINDHKDDEICEGKLFSKFTELLFKVIGVCEFETNKCIEVDGIKIELSARYTYSKVVTDVKFISALKTVTIHEKHNYEYTYQLITTASKYGDLI
jgi:hypothetical protein